MYLVSAHNWSESERSSMYHLFPKQKNPIAVPVSMGRGWRSLAEASDSRRDSAPAPGAKPSVRILPASPGACGGLFHLADEGTGTQRGEGVFPKVAQLIRGRTRM